MGLPLGELSSSPSFCLAQAAFSFECRSNDVRASRAGIGCGDRRARARSAAILDKVGRVSVLLVGRRSLGRSLAGTRSGTLTDRS